jgi:hypothetical protein
MAEMRDMSPSALTRRRPLLPRRLDVPSVRVQDVTLKSGREWSARLEEGIIAAAAFRRFSRGEKPTDVVCALQLEPAKAHRLYEEYQQLEELSGGVIVPRAEIRELEKISGVRMRSAADVTAMIRVADGRMRFLAGACARGSYGHEA